MKFSITAATAALLPLAAAQTYTNCNPRESSNCPADPALGKAATYDFTKGAPTGWTASGTIDYSSKGGAFTVAKQGDSPLITSDFYIMWGHVEFVLQAAPGTGIVSSAVMQSDTLDEIDWEFLGGDSGTVQTNYFGHGDTSVYNREQTFSTPDNQAGVHTYAVDWTADRIVWQIDGTTVRTLTPSNADSGQYPQTPMMIKVGIWAGGDPSNPQGTINWAGGVTDYSKGPFTMYCQSILVTDYSTGSEYKYTSESGTSDSISAVGGSVGGNAGATASVSTEAASPTITSTNSDAPMPWSGTHRDTSTVAHSVWPWVSTATASLTSDPSDWSTSAGSASAPPTVSVSEHFPMLFTLLPRS
ncbi:concanavalin A-like lectin/glucanase domain-containing protein [Talaromyces proteolyticus]|uniref:Crh-like protein n=1 Tax=Talaromyces proteolyticus TaxID=1131652 RepID=A0AAD4KHI3_9EURO|nr:concanavalin A-like lectin/glucanase domain-containing protein [Talaromyces proteolyticus]KAH8689544.1 concanavalin A-like lectin/glucanase domain-containing protein [Talaromyces proteolyticus]